MSKAVIAKEATATSQSFGVFTLCIPLGDLATTTLCSGTIDRGVVCFCSDHQDHGEALPYAHVL